MGASEIGMKELLPQKVVTKIALIGLVQLKNFF